MKTTRLTFNIEFDDYDRINIITAESGGEIEVGLFCKFLSAVSDVRDKYNKEIDEE